MCRKRHLHGIKRIRAEATHALGKPEKSAIERRAGTVCERLGLCIACAVVVASRCVRSTAWGLRARPAVALLMKIQG